MVSSGGIRPWYENWWNMNSLHYEHHQQYWRSVASNGMRGNKWFPGCLSTSLPSLKIETISWWGSIFFRKKKWIRESNVTPSIFGVRQKTRYLGTSTSITLSIFMITFWKKTFFFEKKLKIKCRKYIYFCYCKSHCNFLENPLWGRLQYCL